MTGILLLKEQQVQSALSNEDEIAPEHLFREATRLHPYAIAAYTVRLLSWKHHFSILYLINFQPKVSKVILSKISLFIMCIVPIRTNVYAE